jgi:hypothetical protein
VLVLALELVLDRLELVLTASCLVELGLRVCGPLAFVDEFGLESLDLGVGGLAAGGELAI